MTLDEKVLLAGVAGDILVLAFLLYRKVWRTLPLFTAYIIWTLVSDAVSWYFLFHLKSGNAAYARFYLKEMSVDSVLQFTVLVELAWSVLKPIRASLPKISLLIVAALIALAGLAVWPLAAKALSPLLKGDELVISHVQETFAILRVIFFLVMAGFSQLLAIGWRDRELQVASGLGFYSICSLIAAVIHTHQAPGPEYHRVDLVVIAGYFGTLAYWVYAFSTKEQKRKEFSPQMQQLLLLMGGGARGSRISLSAQTSKRTGKKD